jgi:hypothetical protein
LVTGLPIALTTAQRNAKKGINGIINGQQQQQLV